MEAPAASASSLAAIEIATDYGSWWWFIFITVVFGIIWYFMTAAVNVAEISTNWPKYRCSPGVMPFASAYGYDTAENFNYCMTQVFQSQVGGVTGPFGSILSTMIGNLMEVLQNLNSLRVMMATLVGSISKMMQEFVDRFKLALSQIKLAGVRIQFLMNRLFGTFYAVIYMGLSAVMVGQNFSETIIFKFLDTFCFPPETLIDLQGKGCVEIRSVQVGDLCANGDRVTSTYQFMADGQPMVQLGSVVVSSNHLVKYGTEWIQATNHPDAIAQPFWYGGVTRPLICLDTVTHHIPLGGYQFRDWDETDTSDETVMKLAETRLNGGTLAYPHESRPWKYQPAFHPDTLCILSSGVTKRIGDLALGDTLSTGRVVGLGRRQITEGSTTYAGSVVTPSSLLWNGSQWIRVGHTASVYPVSDSIVYVTVLVLGTNCIELSTGEIFRDMLEVHSPDMEEPTLQAMACSEPEES